MEELDEKGEVEGAEEVGPGEVVKWEVISRVGGKEEGLRGFRC